MANSKTVVLLLLGYYEHEIYKGIVTFANQNGWLLCHPNGFNPSYLSEAAKSCAGILSLHAGQQAIIDLVQQTHLPVVDMSEEIGLMVPRFYTDDRAIGEVAAEDFLERGFRHFCYLSVYLGNSHDPLRSQGFGGLAKSAGRQFYDLSLPIDEMSPQNVKRVLGGLPRPLALMCGSDHAANWLIECCLELGWRVPEDIAVTAVVTEHVYGETAPVPISCVDSNCFTLGYEAAKLLDQQIREGGPAPRETLIKPKGVIVRQSSDIKAIDNSHLRRALAFIEENYFKAIRVEDVVQDSRISHRQLNNWFKEYLDRSILEVLNRRRIEAAKEYLMETDYQMKEIARMCGFNSAHHMNLVFNRLNDTSPRAFRRENS